MNWRRGSWREALGLAIAAVLLVALRPAGEHDLHSGDFRPLLPDGLPEQLAIGDPVRVRIDWSGPVALLRDPTGAPYARLDPAYGRELREALASCRRLRQLPRSDFELEDVGLATPTVLQLGDRRLAFGSRGTDRGYLLEQDADHIVVLDRDPAALLGQHPDVLRPTSLGFPDLLKRIVSGRGWALATDAGRWWLEPEPGARDWADQAAVIRWLTGLVNAPVVAYGRPERELERASLAFIGSDQHGRPDRMTLVDLGPDESGRGRYLRREQAIGDEVLQEYLLVQLDAVLLDPDVAALRNDRLLPLDPRRAEAIRFGRISLSRGPDGGWLLQGDPDADQQQIGTLLEQLAAMPRLEPEPEPDGSDPITVTAEGTSFTLPYTDPRCADLLSRLDAHHLRDRNALAGITARSIIGVAFAPDDAAPQLYGREPGKPWPTEIRAEIAPFLELLTDLQVERWTASLPLDAATPFAVESRINIATPDRRLTLRLDGEGHLHVPERGLVGRLDAASREKLYQ